MDVSKFRDRIITIITIITIAVFSLLLDSVGVINSLYNVSDVISIPIRQELRTISQNVNNFLGAITKITSLQSENDRLNEENISLKEELSTFLECKTNKAILEEQLKLTEITTEPIVETRIISSNIAIENVIQINAGSLGGIEEGDIAVFGSYAVGEVIKVEQHSSRVELITSPSSNIPVRGQKNRAQGLAKGNVGLTLSMQEILLDEIIEEGEIVITSGVDSQFPAGLIVGIVSVINDNPAFATKEAIVEVQLDFKKLDYLYIIKGQK